MASPPTTPPPLRSRAYYTSRDSRIQVQTLLRIGHPVKDIASSLDLSYRQVRYAAINPVTPRKRSGRPPLLTAEEIDYLIEFVCSSAKNRRLPWSALPAALGWDCSQYAVRHALRKAGFSRRVALRKPPISERTRALRLEFAYRYRDWTVEDWSRVLFSDEKWVTGGRHRKTYLTRRRGEELDPTCIVERHQRKQGWMFWGCYSGLANKGPSLF